MTDLKALAAAALGTTPDNIHTAVEVGTELIALDRNLAKYRWPMASLLDKASARAAPPEPPALSLSQVVANSLTSFANPGPSELAATVKEEVVTPVPTEAEVTIVVDPDLLVMDEPVEASDEEPVAEWTPNRETSKKSRRKSG